MNPRRSHISSSKSKRVHGIKKKLKTKKKKQRAHVVSNPWCKKRANEIVSKLPPGSLSFTKKMRHSHVVSGFWLGLPRDFCVKNLTEGSKIVDLVVGANNENRHPTKYLSDSTGLSGGWVGFSKAHKLKVGDFLVFQLLNSCTFKVHIVRVSESEGNSEKRTEDVEIDYDDDDDKLFENNKIKDVKCFDDFKIKVDGRVLDDSVISARTREKYFELCVSREMILHENHEKGLDSELVARVISGTIEIADGIRAATDTCGFEAYDRRLERYESYGMEVGFLRARIDELVGMTREWLEVSESMMSEVKDEEDLFRGVEAEHEDVQVLIEMLVDEIRGLEVDGRPSGRALARPRK